MVARWPRLEKLNYDSAWLMSMSQAYELNRTEALVEASRVAEVVNGWQTHFAASGVDGNTISSLADQIDRGYLLPQRNTLVG